MSQVPSATVMAQAAKSQSSRIARFIWITTTTVSRRSAVSEFREIPNFWSSLILSTPRRLRASCALRRRRHTLSSLRTLCTLCLPISPSSALWDRRVARRRNLRRILHFQQWISLLRIGSCMNDSMIERRMPFGRTTNISMPTKQILMKSMLLS